MNTSLHIWCCGTCSTELCFIAAREEEEEGLEETAYRRREHRSHSHNEAYCAYYTIVNIVKGDK